MQKRHPSITRRTRPTEACADLVAETGETVTFAELDRRSNRAAQLFRSAGLAIGDTIALLLENVPAFYDVAWGAQRSGALLYLHLDQADRARGRLYRARQRGQA